ncbi:MAG: energy-coupling factor ABC transporter ATP-binding protein [Candidatus Jordarchaeum sp.]|uniref:energy-coupling factor ABC transporter ATP-binding protein n=1 Tax=Candidatus Jordarchaeum sp. TaxID=2823881 RepID=UPI00404A7CFC
MTIAIRMEDVKHRYPDGTPSLYGVDLSIEEGDSVAVLGANGSGKTTLLLHLNGTLHPLEGSVYIYGKKITKKNVDYARKNVGVIFQESDDQLFMPTVMDDVAFGALNIKPKEEALEETEKLLKELDLYKFRKKVPHFLSGGQKKLVALAGVLIMRPKILVMDEPTANLDFETKNMIISIIKRLKKEYKFTLIFTSFDVQIIPVLADKVAIMKKGRVIAYDETRKILTDEDLLKQAGVEPPPFVRLAKRLGFDRIPLTLEEAEEEFQKMGPIWETKLEQKIYVK